MIVTARKLANASPNRPRQNDLRRSVSTAYYALFHALAKDAADLLVGVGNNRSDKARRQVYRALQHGDAKSACIQLRSNNPGFPQLLVDCAGSLTILQEKRHSADYDPDYRATRAEALEAIAIAERAIANLTAAGRNDRRAFAILLLFKKRP